jgi:16S rRNA (cytidine1402-2'-O)-methyltransferase
MHETFYRDSINTIKPFKTALKGELTIVISKIYQNNEIESDKDITSQAEKYLKKYSLKDVVELISKKEKISKKKVYEVCLKIKNNDKNN